MTRQYVCTRPKLATELIKRGFIPKIEPSPWVAGQTAWVFEVNDDLKQAVNSYYKRIGKPSPLEVSEDVGSRYVTKRGIEVRA